MGQLELLTRLTAERTLIPLDARLAAASGFP